MVTYVYESVEVKKTGRLAHRDVKNTKGDIIKTAILVEITPVDDTFDWKKWVDPAHLFLVKDDKDK